MIGNKNSFCFLLLHNIMVIIIVEGDELVSEKLNELYNRKKELEMGGSTQPAVARERINMLLDANSFVEFGAFVKQRSTDFNAANFNTPADGVVTGYGTIENRLVFVYSQDNTVLGGSVGEMHAKKICSVYEQAMKMGAPVVGFLDSSGMRVQEGIDAFEAYGQIYKAMSAASGVIPQITAVMGGCMGSSSLIPALSDFVFAVDKNAKLFMVSPNTLEGADGKKGDLSLNSEENGLVQFSFQSEEDCIKEMRKFIDFVPSNNMEDSPFFGVDDDINRADEFLNTIVSENKESPLDMNVIIKALADKGDFMEIHRLYAKDVTTGFMRMNGDTVGIIANQVSLLGYHGVDKIIRFVSFCDAFNLPIITLTDIAGYKANMSQGALIKYVAKLVHAFAAATVPKINVLLRNSFGNAYVAMNSKHIGADVVFAWPTAQVSVMEPEAAVNVMYADEWKDAENAAQLKAEKLAEFEEKNSSAYTAAGHGYIDDIIEPAATRKRLIASLEMLASKREGKPSKKHASLTL